MEEAIEHSKCTKEKIDIERTAVTHARSMQRALVTVPEPTLACGRRSPVAQGIGSGDNCMAPRRGCCCTVQCRTVPSCGMDISRVMCHKCLSSMEEEEEEVRATWGLLHSDTRASLPQSGIRRAPMEWRRGAGHSRPLDFPWEVAFANRRQEKAQKQSMKGSIKPRETQQNHQHQGGRATISEFAN